MKSMINLMPLVIVMLFFAACSKDNQEAKKLDGTWELQKWSWEGKDTVQAGSYSDTLGTWNFVSCKAANQTCEGTVSNFPSAKAEESISWYIRDNGESFTMGADDATSSLANLTGEWQIEELSDNSFVVTSETCGSCSITGRTKLEFDKP